MPILRPCKCRFHLGFSLEKTHGMDSLEILNAILNFAQAEGIIENQDKNHKDLILNHVQRALTKTAM